MLAPAKAPTPSNRYRSFDYRGFAHRLRVSRIVLGITEAEAAAVAGRSVNVWKKYEATGKGNNTAPIMRFVDQYSLSFDWLVTGDGDRISPHLAKRAQGKVVILPVKGPNYRSRQVRRQAEQIRERYAALSLEDQRRVSAEIHRLLDEQPPD